MTTENEFVRRLTDRFPAHPPVEVGIGDDGAVLLNAGADRTVIVTDLLLDGVHFDLKTAPVRLAGRKAVAVNLSDLAAMGCLPTAAFVSIAIPKGLKHSATHFLEELYAGIEELTTQYNFCLAGGDTNAWHGPFAINVCLTGRPMPGRSEVTSVSAEQGDLVGPGFAASSGTAQGQPVLRSTARPGDRLFVTGPLGGSLIHGRHLTFSPRLDAAAWLLQHVSVNAMMDLSDGLSTDLHRMVAASHCGAILQSSAIPIHADVPETLGPAERLAAAFGDGEDFELLFSISPEDVPILLHRAAADGFHFHEIGTIVEGAGIKVRDQHGQLHPLSGSGWEHQL